MRCALDWLNDPICRQDGLDYGDRILDQFGFCISRHRAAESASARCCKGSKKDYRRRETFLHIYPYYPLTLVSNCPGKFPYTQNTGLCAAVQERNGPSWCHCERPSLLAGSVRILKMDFSRGLCRSENTQGLIFKRSMLRFLQKEIKLESMPWSFK